MPVQLSYPGVYIEELSSGVRTITGVATSIAAFVGWAPKGPTDEAGLVFNPSDYARLYGGLHAGSMMSYAVAHFFANGGQQAYIVRIVAEDAETASATVGSLQLTATGPGEWANAYSVQVKALASDSKRFGLEIFRPAATPSTPRQTVESFTNLSMHPDDLRFVTSVVNEQSQLVNATVPDGAEDVPDDEQELGGGRDGEILAPDSKDFWEAAKPEAPEDGTPRGGIYLLERVDLFNLLCVPGLVETGHLADLATFCRDHRAFLIADAENTGNPSTVGLIKGDDGINAAMYYPWVRMPDPRQEGRLRAFPPSGVIAGIYARTDANRGVWKAPAGIDASLNGVRYLEKNLIDGESGNLNKKAVNALRSFPIYGAVAWGARTCRGNDEIGSEWKYVPVRRTALYLEESLFRALKWVVFEPNDEPLWAQIRLNVGAFLHDQFRKGAFQGSAPRDAYFVKCDKETTTQNDINLGIVNIVVGFAPLKPAEFVVIKLQQIAGQILV